LKLVQSVKEYKEVRTYRVWNDDMSRVILNRLLTLNLTLRYLNDEKYDEEDFIKPHLLDIIAGNITDFTTISLTFDEKPIIILIIH